MENKDILNELEQTKNLFQFCSGFCIHLKFSKSITYTKWNIRNIIISNIALK